MRVYSNFRLPHILAAVCFALISGFKESGNRLLSPLQLYLLVLLLVMLAFSACIALFSVTIYTGNYSGV
ncbi:MAG: hypothetical protein ACJAT1_001169 [Marivirga sp.]|jgi:hypothetical protein